ncbi:hypothetical protein SLS53_009176 [Cytospora paraplurivora]|uniref:Uncharacterized protein n=1 Tax=Cytospora paraplurivora TaxID=2898453 RepID=A0AAN9YC52_9PEZI
MPPKVSPNANPLGLTTREVEIMVLSWKCIEGDTKVQIDSNKLAALANIGKAESASRMWRGIKSKIDSATVGGDGGAGPSAPATPAETTPKKKATTGGGKKRGKKDVDTDEDDDSGSNEPKVTKAKKQPAKRAKKQKPEAATADFDHEEDDVLPKDEDA